jgi:hypothetical protein
VHLLRQRHLAFVLLLAVLVLGPSACGWSSTIVAPTNVSPALVERFLGAPAEVAMLGDIAAMRSDSVYGRLLTRKPLDAALDDPSTKWLLERVDLAEFWALGDFDEGHDPTAIGLLRSGRIKEADLRALSPQLTFDARTVLPSGVVFFVAGGKAHGAVFLVEGNLVFAVGAAVTPAHAHFLHSHELPPKLDFGGGVLLGFHGERALFQRTSRMNNHAVKPWEAHVASASLALRTGDLGDATNGKRMWETALPAPAFFTASSTELFVPVGAEGIRIFDVRSGKERAFPLPAAAPLLVPPGGSRL